MRVPAVAQFVLLLLVAVPASIVDFRTFRIPDLLSLGGAALALALAGVLVLIHGAILPLVSAVLGYVLGFGLFFAVSLGMPGKLGFGDVKFAGFLGACLGLPLWFAAIFLSALSGLLTAAVVVVAKRRVLSGRLPFGPFLSFGSIASVLLAWLIPAVGELLAL